MRARKVFAFSNPLEQYPSLTVAVKAATVTIFAMTVCSYACAARNVRASAESNRTATDCTLFASASGKDSNSGTRPNSPKTFAGAAQAGMPGAVVCVMGGSYSWTSTFYPPRSGTANSWIVYKAYGDSPVDIVWNGGSASGSYIFSMYSSNSFPNGYSYLEFSGFNMLGNNQAAAGIYCKHGHHMRFTHNHIKDFGGAGIATVGCDYLTSDHNLIEHNGYYQGWSSGISYNSVPFYDSYTGFHNIISNNIISGSYDGSANHSDGNGIILDLSSSGTAGISYANSPAALVVNNVVYQNGGRCIHAYTVTNAWIVNNTCYKNDLDTSVGGGNAGQIGVNASYNAWFVNNISYSWRSNNPAYYSDNGSHNVGWYRNMYYIGGLDFTASDPSQFFNANPLFISPPLVNATAGEQYVTAMPPDQLANGLSLQRASPAIGQGVDTSTLPHIPPAIAQDLKKYVYTDINGNGRSQPPSLGAFR